MSCCFAGYVSATTGGDEHDLISDADYCNLDGVQADTKPKDTPPITTFAMTPPPQSTGNAI